MTEPPIITKEMLEGIKQANEERSKICEELKEIYKQREIKRKEEILSKIKGGKSKK